MVPFRRITIISDGGLSVYHHSFANERISEFLFSSLTGAIVSFSKELGDELISINMKEQVFYFYRLNNKGILILSVDPSTSSKVIKDKVDMLVKIDELNLMLDTANSLGIVHNTADSKIDDKVREVFDQKKDESLISQIEKWSKN